ncbi:membrane progestin receptor delta isoform X1 [Meles meles]|uniref:membrane progestin receptor delta isoform X1 n=1 Tax=Meles meles TaxID=9662 RepID=UPI001E69A13E|nr:membrane progestin receptor delta isoform X1 [Meles meles]
MDARSRAHLRAQRTPAPGGQARPARGEKGPEDGGRYLMPSPRALSLGHGVELPGHHAQSQAAPAPASPPGPSGEGLDAPAPRPQAPPSERLGVGVGGSFLQASLCSLRNLLATPPQSPLLPSGPTSPRLSGPLPTASSLSPLLSGYLGPAVRRGSDWARLWGGTDLQPTPCDAACGGLAERTGRAQWRPPTLCPTRPAQVFWEDGILSGYRRPSSSARDCVLSSFQMTNETANIWTHFLPTWYFVWRLLALAGAPGFRAEPYHRPLLVFLLPACLYPFASCCAHTFSSMSPRARHICYFLDYGALSLYSLGCAFPYAAYSMPASWLHSRLHRLFVPAAALNSFLCTGLSCYSRFPELESPGLSKVLRTAAFAYPFLFDNLPLFYRLGLCWVRGPGCGQDALSASHGYHLLCALLTGFLFASHLPERLAPGRFDYIGHSHQLFHICAVLGTHFQLEAVLADMGSRRAWLATQEPPVGLAGTVAALGLAVAGNLLIIAAFTSSLLRAPSTCPLVQGGPLEGGMKARQQ